MGFPDMSIDIEMNNSMQMFLIGVSMAIVGNTLIACSLTLQKWCHMREASGGLKASSTPLFWLALAGLIGGEVGNFAAFGFASQTVVSPLGAVSVIVSTVLAAIFLGEPIYRLTLLGIALVLVGSVCVVLFSPPALGALTTNDFVKLLSVRAGKRIVGNQQPLCVRLHDFRGRGHWRARGRAAALRPPLRAG